MAKYNINTKRGFTIIEVVLVLAIAGLIFLMVFIALPNMQRSQRDTQRRNDYATLSANITNYITNNNGRLPGNTDGTVTTLAAKTYINVEGKDPSGTAYTLKTFQLSSGKSSEDISGVGKVTALTSNGTAPKVFVVGHSHCSLDSDTKKSTANGVEGSSIPVYDSNNRSFSIFGQLETGTYCQSSK